MAIYHFSAQVISRVSNRGTLRSVVAAAAYRSGEELYSRKDNETKFYQREVAPENYLLVPKNAPEWAKDRETLWNKVEEFEKPYNAQLAREINIALPKELSNEEQTKLALEFCQANFVDKGMVADIAIHRDKENNPHFHVMLTLREFDENGEFKAKCRKVYELDKDGNKILLPSGMYKSHRENTNNWNDKSTLMSWRENWQDIANRYLAERGVSERIDCRSYEKRNITLMPTVHEGCKVHHATLKGVSTERGNYNQQVREYNNNIVKLEAYKAERANQEAIKISRCFKPAEKQQIVSAARELKLYINTENLETRIKQLERWNKSLFYNQDSLRRFERILKEQKIIENVKSIMEKEAFRFCDKYYSGIQLLPDERIKLVERTIEENRILESREIAELKLSVREKEFDNVTKYLLTNGNSFWLDAVQAIQKEEAKARVSEGRTVPADSVMKLDRAKGLYHIYQDRETAENFIGYQNNRNEIVRVTDNMSVQEAHKQLVAHIRDNAEIPMLPQYDIQKVERLEQALCVMDKLYDEYIKQSYGNHIPLKNLSIPEKEMILHYEEYYGVPYQNHYEPAPPYATKEKEDIIKHLVAGEKGKVFDKYSQFKNNNAYLNMFVMDCLSDEKLDLKYKDDIRNHIMSDEKSPHREDIFNIPISPRTLISQLLRGIGSEMQRNEGAAANHSMSSRIRRRRHKSVEQAQQSQII